MSVMIASALLPIGPAASGEITFQFVNPGFGGNPFNSNYLIGTANLQNDFTDPDRRSSNVSSLLRQQTSSEELFARQLQSRLLSNLSTEIVDAIFGENPQDQGEVVFGAQQITFARTLESIELKIENTDTGEVTEFSVPVLQIN